MLGKVCNGARGVAKGLWKALLSFQSGLCFEGRVVLAMSIRFTEKEIENLLAERKELPADYKNLLLTRPKRGHKERELSIKGGDGSLFRVILRQSNSNPLGFSAIVAFCVPNSNQLFRLCRYNGKNHEHTNTIEKETFYDFHIHMATERYQDIGFREDAYAEKTDRFADFHGAIRCMWEDCGFGKPYDPQGKLFEE